MMLIPTTVVPITAPLLKATRSPGLRPLIAALAVRVLARTAMLMPMYPVPAEQIAPTT